MKGDDPEFVLAHRLAVKFFPESKAFLPGQGLHWDAFLGAMMRAEYAVDSSCSAVRKPANPDLGLAAKGGLQGRDDEIYQRLLAHAAISPTGRAVIVPDAIGIQGWSTEECPPFVCDSQTVPTRLRGATCFGSARDTLFIFESGEAMLLDHDERFHWARSRINRPRPA